MREFSYSCTAKFRSYEVRTIRYSVCACGKRYFTAALLIQLSNFIRRKPPSLHPAFPREETKTRRARTKKNTKNNEQVRSDRSIFFQEKVFHFDTVVCISYGYMRIQYLDSVVDDNAFEYQRWKGERGRVGAGAERTRTCFQFFKEQKNLSGAVSAESGDRRVGGGGRRSTTRKSKIIYSRFTPPRV